VTTVEAQPSVARRTISRRTAWLGSYVTLSVLAAVLPLLRMRWAQPDAAWQTNLNDIDDIHRVVNHGLDLSALHVGLGGEHALTGYRWFLYANAAFFGFNTQVELVAYFLLTLTLSLLIGLRLFRQLDEVGGSALARAIVFVVPLALGTMSGAGSRGMEIGQYTGFTVFVVLALLIRSRLSVRGYAVLVVAVIVPAGLLILGSYLGGPALALCAASLLEWRLGWLDRAARRKLWVLTAGFVIMLGVWLLLMTAIGPSEVGGRLPGFLHQVAEDPAFVPKYFLAGAAGSVITSQTLEVGGHGARFAYAVGALVTVFAAVAVALHVRRPRVDVTVPLLLLLAPVGLASTLIVGRSDGALWMLSPWYGFELHLFLVGAVALTALGVGTRRRAGRSARWDTVCTVTSVALLAVILGLTAYANTMQWRRQPAERAYFQRIQEALLHPESLTTSAGGLTQLILPLEQSRHAIEILRADGLNVYRDPGSVLAQMGKAGQYSAGLSLAGMLDTAWAGDHVTILVQDTACTTLTLDVTPFPAAVTDLPASVPSASVLTVDSSFGDDDAVPLADEPVRLTLHPSGDDPSVLLRFSRTWTPQELGIGADERALSAQLVATCSGSPSAD
jgi:hypothetical protein